MTTGLLSMIDAARDAAPQSVAVRGPDGTLTYDELVARADRLAATLRASGVRPGDFVGQCLERSASLVVAALGIVRAGCAYVAIDPRYPDARIRWLLEDSGAAALVTDESTLTRISTPGVASIILGAAGELGDELEIELSVEPEPTDPAYVVYTSGSTGQPKGVVLEHAGLTNLVDWHRATFGLEAGDRCTQISSPGFDAAIWEIWPSLASGAALHVVPEELRTDPVGLRDWLVAEKITVSFLPTAVTEVIIGLPWPEPNSLRFMLTGGDALSSRPPAGLGFALVNNYGLSETTVVATSAIVSPDGFGPPTIGRPIAGVDAEVVDERLLPVAPGEPGELVIGGVAVGRGYLNQPELTRERFLSGPNGRRYRTGDIVRMRPDGEIEFAGRVDDQLSIRGFRVEPGEVAAGLNSHPAIQASVAVGVGSSSSDRQLVAYLVAGDEEHPSSESLNEFLGHSLPGYMIPSRYIWLDRLPLTTHGKIDRQALPDPGASESAETNGADPNVSVESQIASVIAGLLKVEEVGVTENFFLLGGHSMLGAQLIVRLERLFGAEVSLRYLFDHPTAAELSKEVERQMAADQAAVKVTT